MIALYKKWRDKANTTGWGLDTSNHDQIGDNTCGKTIREVLLLKCLFFYDFEEIMGDSPIITPPYLMESGHPNWDVEVKKASSHKDDMCNLNTQQYNCWIDGDERVDPLSEREESDKLPSQSFWEKSWSPMPVKEDFLPSQPDHQVLTTTDNKESDDNLDLL